VVPERSAPRDAPGKSSGCCRPTNVQLAFLVVVFDADGFDAVLLAPDDFAVDDFDVDDLAAAGFEVLLAVLFAAVPDFATGFFAVDFEDFEDFEATLLDDVGFRLFAERDLLRATRTGRFQPTALSARNVVGIDRIFSGLSITAAAAASARSARTSEMTLAGRRARAAWTRFVRSSTNICRSGSIQIDVPV